MMPILSPKRLTLATRLPLEVVDLALSKYPLPSEQCLLTWEVLPQSHQIEPDALYYRSMWKDRRRQYVSPKL